MLRTAGCEDRARLVAFLDAHRSSCRARRCGSPPSTSRPASGPATSSPGAAVVLSGGRAAPTVPLDERCCVLRPRPDAAGRGLGRGVLGRHADGRVHVAQHPGGALRLRAVQPHRRDAAVDGAGPAGGQPGQGPVAGGDDGRRRGRRREAGGDGPAVRRADLRAAPGRRPADRAGHDDALRPRQAAGRPARARRRHRHPLRRQRRRHVRRHARRAVRVGRRQARGRPDVGRRPRHRPQGELCVLRQLLRHPAARRRRHADRRSTPTRGWCSWRRRAAGRSSTSTSRRAS